MTSQLIFDKEDTHSSSSLTIPHHLNDSLIGKPGLQVAGASFPRISWRRKKSPDCIDRIDAAGGEWRDDLSRRVQHYGWRYDYKARAITPDMHIGALPDWLQQLAQRLHDETNLFDRVPEQVIVNEYLPGQGIAMHTDHRGLRPHRLHHFAGRRLGDGFFRGIGATSGQHCCSIAALWCY